MIRPLFLNLPRFFGIINIFKQRGVQRTFQWCFAFIVTLDLNGEIFRKITTGIRREKNYAWINFGLFSSKR